jgi:glycosyltransferase involved in cell wall biosynthesis
LGDGGKLIFSVHNAMPHDARLPHWEIKLQREIVGRASMLHILTASTPERVGEFFTIPEDRTLHVPHPHYIGAYPDFVSKPHARHELSVDVDETTYAFVGAIRPYKGLDLLLDAFGAVASPLLPRRRLLVAGRPLDHPDVHAFRRRCLLDARVTIRASKVPDEEMQYYLRASDLAILPYQRSLNSGVLMLALSFGLPVIAPDDPGTAEILEPSFSRTFQPGDADSLVAAIRAADELLTPDAAEAALAAARRYEPGPLSIRFAEGLRKFLG